MHIPRKVLRVLEKVLTKFGSSFEADTAFAARGRPVGHQPLCDPTTVRHFGANGFTSMIVDPATGNRLEIEFARENYAVAVRAPYTIDSWNGRQYRYTPGCCVLLEGANAKDFDDYVDVNQSLEEQFEEAIFRIIQYKKECERYYESLRTRNTHVRNNKHQEPKEDAAVSRIYEEISGEKLTRKIHGYQTEVAGFVKTGVCGAGKDRSADLHVTRSGECSLSLGKLTPEEAQEIVAYLRAAAPELPERIEIED